MSGVPNPGQREIFRLFVWREHGRQKEINDCPYESQSAL